jgi:hypothetical protein
MRTIDGARSWKLLHVPQNFASVSFRDSLTGFAVGIGTAYIWKTTDGGQSWSYRSWVDSYNQPIAVALSFVDTSNGWFFSVVFYQGDLAEAIYRTTDGGLTWKQESVGLTRYINAGQMLDTLHGWAVCDGGVVLGYISQTTSVKPPDTTPKRFHLYQNYPNPFNPTTTIEYELATRALVKISIIDMLGRTLRSLVEGEQEAGVHRVHFDAGDLASGIYNCTMKAGAYRETRQLILLK